MRKIQTEEIFSLEINGVINVEGMFCGQTWCSSLRHSGMQLRVEETDDKVAELKGRKSGCGMIRAGCNLVDCG